MSVGKVYYQMSCHSIMYIRIGFNLLSLHRVQVHRQHNVFSAFNPSLVIKEEWAAVMRPGSNWGFSALLKDTSTCN